MPSFSITLQIIEKINKILNNAYTLWANPASYKSSQKLFNVLINKQKGATCIKISTVYP